ncbi:MAG: hypothetical protein HY784_00190 [Chloroflexi bacterium]|nr:hypothetical protein [Chloroflexota bacterium]
MRNVWVIARREFNQYFVSPLAYAIAFLIFLILGVLFYASLAYAFQTQQPPDPTATLGPLVTIYLFAVPAITMRLLADEQRMGTIELLLTAPTARVGTGAGEVAGRLPVQPGRPAGDVHLSVHFERHYQPRH